MSGGARRPWELEDDRELVAAFRRGETAALERIFRNYAPSVEALLRSGFSYERSGERAQVSGLGSAFDVEDRLHEVFARAFSTAGRQGYDGLGSYGAYLHGVTRNLVLDELRRGNREQLMADPEPAPLTSDSATDALLGELDRRGLPERDAEDSELVRLVREFKDRLPERDREVFELRFSRELGHPQIAEQTGLSPSQIKTSEKRIRTALFRHLQRSGYLAGYGAGPQGWLRRLGGRR